MIKLWIGLFIIPAFAGFDGLWKDVQELRSIASECQEIPKIKRKKLMHLNTKNQPLYESFMKCKHMKRNRRRDFLPRCRVRKNKMKLRGSLSYGSAFSPYKGPYRYDIIKTDEGYTLKVNIRFRSKILDNPISSKHMPEEFESRSGVLMITYRDLIDHYLDKASKLWTEFSPIEDLTFEFKRVDSKRKSHFTVGYIDKLKSILYNYKWNTYARENRFRNRRHWIQRVYSHEIGHMMGLEDEYSRIRAIINPGYFMYKKNGYQYDCSTDSLMCNAVVMWTQKDPLPRPYHYYLILNRMKRCF